MSAGTQVTLGEAFSKAAEAASEPTAVQDDPQPTDELPCGHAAVYAESGACMVCDPAFATAADAEVYREQNPDVYGRSPL